MLHKIVVVLLVCGCPPSCTVLQWMADIMEPVAGDALERFLDQ